MTDQPAGPLVPGSRVRDRIWGGTYEGTVTRVDADGSVFVQWDATGFTEDQRSSAEVEAIDDTGDPTPRYAVVRGGLVADRNLARTLAVYEDEGYNIADPSVRDAGLRMRDTGQVAEDVA